MSIRLEDISRPMPLPLIIDKELTIDFTPSYFITNYSDFNQDFVNLFETEILVHLPGILADTFFKGETYFTGGYILGLMRLAEGFIDQNDFKQYYIKNHSDIDIGCSSVHVYNTLLKESKRLYPMTVWPSAVHGSYCHGYNLGLYGDHNYHLGFRSYDDATRDFNIINSALIVDLTKDQDQRKLKLDMDTRHTVNPKEIEYDGTSYLDLFDIANCKQAIYFDRIITNRNTEYWLNDIVYTDKINAKTYDRTMKYLTKKGFTISQLEFRKLISGLINNTAVLDTIILNDIETVEIQNQISIGELKKKPIKFQLIERRKG